MRRGRTRRRRTRRGRRRGKRRRRSWRRRTITIWKLDGKIRSREGKKREGRNPVNIKGLN